MCPNLPATQSFTAAVRNWSAEASSSRCAQWEAMRIWRKPTSFCLAQARRNIEMRNMIWLMASFSATLFAAGAAAQEIDWQNVDDAFGRKAAISEDVHRYGLPRSDLSV